MSVFAFFTTNNGKKIPFKKTESSSVCSIESLQNSRVEKSLPYKFYNVKAFNEGSAIIKEKPLNFDVFEVDCAKLEDTPLQLNLRPSLYIKNQIVECCISNKWRLSKVVSIKETPGLDVLKDIYDIDAKQYFSDLQKQQNPKRMSLRIRSFSSSEYNYYLKNYVNEFTYGIQHLSDAEITAFTGVQPDAGPNESVDDFSAPDPLLEDASLMMGGGFTSIPCSFLRPVYRVNCIIEHENKQGIVIDIEVKEREILSYTIQIGEEEEKKVDVYSLKFLLEKGDVCEANTPKGIMKHKVLKKLENSSYELKFGLATVSNFDYRLIQFVPIEQGMMGNLWRGKKPTKGCLLLNRLKNAGIRQKELSTTTSTNDSTSTDDSNIQVSKNDKGTKNDKVTKNDKNKKIMKNN